MTEAEVRFRIFERVLDGLEDAPFSLVTYRAKMSHAISDIVLSGSTYEAEEIIRCERETAE